MSSDRDFYVFREGRRTVEGERLLASTRESLERAADENGWIDALLRCGELECALEDAGAASANAVAGVLDVCADALVGGDWRQRGKLGRSLPENVPAELQVSTPEGFAYYALHPLQYAEVVERFGDVRDAVVVGIRSIGTTLSAVTAAALRKEGARVERFTVRPMGHPFDRVVAWNDLQRRAIETHPEGLFVIVDEGPGLSGSSFLSVAEALCAAGVRKERIVMVPAHAPNAAELCSRDAAARWAQFRCVPIEAGRHPQGEWMGAGAWRAKFSDPDERQWPGAWTQLERAKFLSPDGQVFWKFEGLGPYGERAREEARLLAENGFGAAVVAEEQGYTGYEFLRGRALRKQDVNAERLRRIAAYCAFRAEHFATEISAAQKTDLETMVRVNFERGFEEPFPEMFAHLEMKRTINCDAKMGPHEWIEADGKMLKLDATEHGDNHFFPGPCDVAWDLAGAIVEWSLDAFQRGALLRMYAEMTGDDAGPRVRNYLLAYAVFQHAWSRTAAVAMRGTPDAERLLRCARKYQAWVVRLVHSESRCTVLGENAGRRSAIYSVPAASGAE